jgi:hypothetical protein
MIRKWSAGPVKCFPQTELGSRSQPAAAAPDGNRAAPDKPPNAAAPDGGWGADGRTGKEGGGRGREGGGGGGGAQPAPVHNKEFPVRP